MPIKIIDKIDFNNYVIGLIFKTYDYYSLIFGGTYL